MAETELSPEQASEIRRQLTELDSPRKINGSPTPPLSQLEAAMGQADSAPGPPRKAADAGQLLQNLMARPDLMSSLRKVVPGLSPSVAPVPPVPTIYKDLAQVEPIALTHASLARIRPGIHDILYAGYGNQCSQCGWRTRDQGGDLMKRHLDWHFRRNRREQSSTERRAMARGWYQDQAQWEAGPAAAEASAAEAQAGPPGASAAAAETETSDEEAIAALKRKTVPVEAGRTDPCAICKEAFARRFDEDDENWVLVNAVVVDGAMLHATCEANRH
ncbi:mRNA 3' end processing factor [Coemansia spiralis]|nr:mRNA 3' end processing factor [Coemansia spiralis]